LYWGKNEGEGELKLCVLESSKGEGLRKCGEESVGEGKAGVLGKELLARIKEKV
jgi:hypothetical protein